MSKLEGRSIGFIVLALFFGSAPLTHAILAGGEFDLPTDFPSQRIDPATTSSFYDFIGALNISIDGSNYTGTASALSPHWVLTAGHNVDFNDDGAVDNGLAIEFHLPGFGSYAADNFFAYPDFAGFGNPTVFHDLSLIYFADPLPQINFPGLGLSMEIGNTLTLVGFGRSGYGSYGYTSQAGTEDRRIGQNVVESFESTSGYDQPLLFRYTFDAPDSLGSLGNDVETIIGPGDSGGPAFIDYKGSSALVGINTFTEGYGGRFGDIGGGVVLVPYWDWISETTGLTLIPELSTIAFWLGIAGMLVVFIGRRNPNK